MSTIATVIGFVILLLRKVTDKRISPKCNCIIWLVFVIALICPISMPSRVSIYNLVDVESIKQDDKPITNNKWNFMIEENIYEKDRILELEQEFSRNTNKIDSKILTMIISDIWLVICLINLSRTISSYISLNHLTGNKELVDERIIGILERCKKELKIKRNIRIIEQDFIKRPSTTGLFHVKIFIPDEVRSLEDAYITDILMHELSHYKRKDHFLNMVMMLAKCVYWFNPMIYYLFKYMRNDMELATDEMAIHHLKEDEKLEYCRVIVTVAKMNASKVEAVLGLSDSVKALERRIDMVLLKEKFDKQAKPIMLFTILIVLLIALTLYPTSYGMYEIPHLYVELEDGSRIVATRIEDEGALKSITIRQNESFKLMIEGGYCEDCVAITRKDLINENSDISILKRKLHKIHCSEKGEYIYQFTLKYGKDKSIDYEIKMIVE